MTDQAPDRRIDLSVTVPGSVEEVWETIATGPGISSWFVPHQVEERQGGTVAMDFGSDFPTETGTVATWDPPHRVVFRGSESDKGPGLAYEWLVEAADGGSCVVRLVNSGFGPGEEWDADFDGMSMGWRLFLENLRLQLTHFPGRRARAVIPTVPTRGPLPQAWSALCRALDVSEDLAIGDRLETTAPGAPALAGVVESTLELPAMRAIFLLLDAPAPGTAFLTVEGGPDVVMASIYLYLHGPAGDAGEWTSWLRSALPAAPEPVSP